MNAYPVPSHPSAVNACALTYVYQQFECESPQLCRYCCLEATLVLPVPHKYCWVLRVPRLSEAVALHHARDAEETSPRDLGPGRRIGAPG